MPVSNASSSLIKRKLRLAIKKIRVSPFGDSAIILLKPGKACGVDALCVIGGKAEEKLKIEVTKPVQCTMKSQNGDYLHVHYTGTLVDGTEFDNSRKRGHPYEFTIGIGHAIKGWELGLLDMCVGEKRRLTIPPELGYGDGGFDTLIPPGSTLIFDT